MLTRILEYLLVAGMSALKVVPGVGFAVGFNFHSVETFVAVFVGGMIGVAFYSFFGLKLRKMNKLRRKKNPKFAEKTRKNYRKARRIKRLWSKVGITGIALLTPPILSPPIGTFIAVAFGEKRHRILLFMGGSMLLWAALFAFVGESITGFFYG